MTEAELEDALSVEVCELCGSAFDERGPQFDHSHVTLRFRGVLCFNCNVALGHFKEDAMVLARAIEYLETR